MNLKIIIVSLFAVVFVGSVSARILMNDDAPETQVQSTSRGITGGAQSLVAGGNSSTTVPTTDSAAAEDSGFIADSLPFFTEASFFGLLGFALGYFSRKVVKLMLIFAAVGFIGIQLLQYGDIIEVNWQRFIDLLNAAILNLKENDSISAILKDRIPTAGALVAGYALGFRKG